MNWIWKQFKYKKVIETLELISRLSTRIVYSVLLGWHIARKVFATSSII